MRIHTAFTLIEVLVVVSIIALLIAVLLPSLKQAREQSRATVCLSNLKQQGLALAAYSAENQRRFPRAGSFRFDLIEGLYYILEEGDPQADNWGLVNLGVLYPKYTCNSDMLFYCPGNRYVDANGPNGRQRFKECYLHPLKSDPRYIDSHDWRDSPLGAYAYAIPAAPGACPRDQVGNIYPTEVVRANPNNGSEWAYWQYLNDPKDPDPSFLGPFPRASRGKHALHALVSDGYFRRDYYGYHLKGHNVLFSDLHARRVTDPNGKIYNADLSAVRGYSNVNNAQVFMVWEYFSRNP